MGTALVMEHANALAQMIVSEKDKLFDERVEALVKLYRRAEFYLKQGFQESIVCEWSLTSLQGPLRDEGYRRYRELFEKCLPEMAEKIPA